MACFATAIVLWNCLTPRGVYKFVMKTVLLPLLFVSLLTAEMVQPAAAQVKYPWVYPGNFRERVTQADLVVSGTIVSTVPSGPRVVDQVELTSNQASIEVDRVFKGQASDRTTHFVWFSPAPIKGGGVIYSGPPLAKFVAGQRFMVFLRKDATTYVVIMPVYQIEVPLAPVSSRNVADVSVLPDGIRDSEIAGELESAALAIRSHSKVPQD